MPRDWVYRLVRLYPSFWQLFLPGSFWLCSGHFILNFIRLLLGQAIALYPLTNLPMADMAENDISIFTCFVNFGPLDFILLAICLIVSSALSRFWFSLDFVDFCKVSFWLIRTVATNRFYNSIIIRSGNWEIIDFQLLRKFFDQL